jgi:hypothetical protein
MYEQAADDKVRDMARKHLMRLASLDDRDALRRLMEVYRAKVGRCPSTWREIESVLRALRIKVDASGAPFDPSGTPYLLVKDQCGVDLDPKSEVPLK